jgi:sugar lactone lactonase YvrE
MTHPRPFWTVALAVLCMALLALAPVAAQAQGANLISTIAGGNTAGFAGDGGPAARALFNSPTALAVDRAGNVFVADKGNARIRRIDAATGVVTTIAGTGQEGFSDNGGQAIGSQINNFVPAMVTDAAGNLYFADTNNHRIRRITPSGQISTVAGSGPVGLLAGGFAGDGGPATSARLFGPRGLGIDERGNLLIADTVNQRIRRVSALNGTISTVAGSGQQGFAGDDGDPLAARFRNPTALSVDVLGRVHVVDEGNARVRRIVLGDTIRTVMGAGSTTHSGDGGAATAAGMQPLDVTTDGAGVMFMADQANGRVRRAVTDGRISTVAGSGSSAGPNTGDGGPATAATVSPVALAVDRSGGLLIASGNAIRRAGGLTLPPVAGFSLRDGGALDAPATPTQAFGVSANYNVSTTVNVAPVPSGQRLQVYVVALVPGALLNVQPLVVPFLYSAQRRWGPAGNPIQAFASNVDGANAAQRVVVVDLLADFDITLLVGTEFYIGYGVDADEMLRAGRFRGVFKVLPL